MVPSDLPPQAVAGAGERRRRGVFGAGGIGYLAISFGYNRFDNTVMSVTVFGLAVIAIAVQLPGDILARVMRK